MLPADVLKRIPDEGQIVALRMREGFTPKDYYFRMWAKEGPNDYMNFSLGAASAQSTTGTGWSSIQDSSNRYILQPENEKEMYFIYYGVSPSYAWVYRRYPSGEDRGSLIGTRAVGDPTGYIDGVKSPPHTPSALTEIITLMGTYPAFCGYHPYLEPSSITVRMNFYVVVFLVEYIQNPTDAERKGIIPRTMGGLTLIETPSWVRRLLL